MPRTARSKPTAATPSRSSKSAASGAAIAAATRAEIAVMGIDIGKYTFHVIALDRRGRIVLRQKFSRTQLIARLANVKPCLIGMEACVGAHHLARKLATFGHTTRLMPAKYVRPYAKGQKNDFNDAEAIAEAVQRPTMKFVAVKSPDQLDLQALHRVRDKLVSQRTAVINQIRAFLLERGIAVRQGALALRRELPDLLATHTDVLSLRMLRSERSLQSSASRKLDFPGKSGGLFLIDFSNQGSTHGQDEDREGARDRRRVPAGGRSASGNEWSNDQASGR